MNAKFEPVEAKLERYLALTREAKAIAENKMIAAHEKEALDCLRMCTDYYNDALHFKEKKDFATALAAASYAHAWLDAGARLGFFDVKGESRLFTVE